MQSNSVQASSLFSSPSSNCLPLLGEVLDRLLPSESATSHILVVRWLSVTEPSLGSETNVPDHEWETIRTELEGILDFASAIEPHHALIAWGVLRDILARPSSVPSEALTHVAKYFPVASQQSSSTLSTADLTCIFGPPAAVFVMDRVWFHKLPLWAFTLWSARCGSISPTTCRNALQLLYPDVPSTVTWSGPDSGVGLPPVLAALFRTESVSPQDFWQRIFNLPWYTFGVPVLRNFLNWVKLPNTGQLKPMLLARCLSCITWAELHNFPQSKPSTPIIIDARRWSFVTSMSHHQLSLQELSVVSPEYLQELSGSLRIPPGSRDDTIVEVWDALSVTDKLNPAEFFQDISIPVVGSPEDLNFGPLPQHMDFLQGGDAFDIPFSPGCSGASDILQAAIQLAVSEVAIMSRDQRHFLLNREIDASAVGRILLATFQSPTTPSMFTMNFYVCVEVLRPLSAPPLMSVRNVTRDHRQQPETALLAFGQMAVFFTEPALAQPQVAMKIEMPVSRLAEDSNSVWLKPVNDVLAIYRSIRDLKLVKRPEKNASVHSFQDYSGFQMLLAAKTSRDAMSAFQGNPINIINKLARSRDHELQGYCQAHFTDLLKLLGNLQDVNYSTWFPLILALAEPDADRVFRKFNHASAIHTLTPIAYMPHLSKMCVVPTLCNMWRHMEAVYGWDPAMYSALKSISLRLAQLVDNYASGSDTEVVPLLIEYTLDQVSSIFLSANIEDTRYVPPAGASHFTTMPVESLDDIVAALNLVPYIAPCGHMASKLMRIMTNHSSPTTTTSTVDPLVEGGPLKRSRQGEGRFHGGGGSVRRDPKTVGYCRHFMTTEGCNRRSCRYPHLVALPPTADRAFLDVWASGFGLTLRPHL